LSACSFSGRLLGKAVELALAGGFAARVGNTEAPFEVKSLEEEFEKELEGQTKRLEGATMPNGQKYEDWLKDR
jgi:hypothetical protein